MDRTKGILAAGTLTGLVLITILALGFGNLGTVFGGEADSTAADPALALPQTSDATNEEALQAWQDYSAELEQTVRTLQEREATYQAQLETANNTIVTLQNDINSAGAAPAGYRYEDDDDDDDHEEHEYEEHDDD